MTIEGVGGIARVLGASAGTGGAAAIAVSGLNIELDNLDISGVTNGAGVLVESGDAQLYNLRVHGIRRGWSNNPTRTAIS